MNNDKDLKTNENIPTRILKDRREVKNRGFQPTKSADTVPKPPKFNPNTDKKI